MEKYEIEKQIMKSINAPTNDLIMGAVLGINSNGHNFIEVDDEIGIWRDEKKGLELNISALLSVSCVEREGVIKTDTKQKEIEDKFYELAEAGAVKEIDILASFEGDIANGGFDQLYDNKGLGFLKESIAILEAIGSKAKLKLAEEAYELILKNLSNIKQYTEYQKTMLKIDARYYKSKENIPLIYHGKVGV